jgi:hypothetical protein
LITSIVFMCSLLGDWSIGSRSLRWLQNWKLAVSRFVFVYFISFRFSFCSSPHDLTCRRVWWREATMQRGDGACVTATTPLPRRADFRARQQGTDSYWLLLLFSFSLFLLLLLFFFFTILCPFVLVSLIVLHAFPHSWDCTWCDPPPAPRGNGPERHCHLHDSSALLVPPAKLR